MKDNERPVTIWSRSRLNAHWLVERSYPLRYALTLGLPSKPGKSSEIDGRFYAWFESGDNPNHRSKLHRSKLHRSKLHRSKLHRSDFTSF